MYIGLFLTGYILKWFKLYLIEYKANSLTTKNNKIKSQVQTKVNQYKSFKVLPNRLTSVYSKNYYKEENYLTVKTVYLNI